MLACKAQALWLSSKRHGLSQMAAILDFMPYLDFVTSLTVKREPYYSWVPYKVKTYK